MATFGNTAYGSVVSTASNRKTQGKIFVLSERANCTRFYFAGAMDADGKLCIYSVVSGYPDTLLYQTSGDGTVEGLWTYWDISITLEIGSYFLAEYHTAQEIHDELAPEGLTRTNSTGENPPPSPFPASQSEWSVGFGVVANPSLYILYTPTGNPPTANFSATPVYGRAPLTVQFTDLSTESPTSWLWNFGDGTTSTEQNPSHVYRSGGLFTVSLTATNAVGSDTETKNNYIQTLSTANSRFWYKP